MKKLFKKVHNFKDTIESYSTCAPDCMCGSCTNCNCLGKPGGTAEGYTNMGSFSSNSSGANK